MTNDDRPQQDRADEPDHDTDRIPESQPPEPQYVAAVPAVEKTGRWAAVREPARRHPVGAAVGAAAAGLVIGFLGGTLFDAHPMMSLSVGTAPIAHQGPGGPGWDPRGPGEPGHGPDGPGRHHGPDGPGGPGGLGGPGPGPDGPGWGPGGPGRQGPPPPPPGGPGGPAGPGGPGGPAGPGGPPAPPTGGTTGQTPGPGQAADPGTPPLPAERNATPQA